jgi:hypothetical protein
MTGRFEHPDLDKKMEAVRDWLAWCSESNIIWIDQKDGGNFRKANRVWGELRPRQITRQGTDEIRYEDVDNQAGDAEFPRQDVLISWRQIAFELRMRSRDQEHRQSAWYAATRADARSSHRYGRNRWLKPMDLAFADAEAVVNMPTIIEWDDRIEDVANWEFRLNTFLCDRDAAAVGTWIESIEVSSNIRNVVGEPLDASLQLNEESMP